MSLGTVAFGLVAAHFAADFPLQGDTTAIQKSRRTSNPLSKVVPWFYWLTAHAFVQAAGVLIVTGSVVLAAAELVAHWAIDFGKCEDWYSIHVDQFLHLACKAAYLLMIWKGWM